MTISLAQHSRARDIVARRLGLHFPHERGDDFVRRLRQASREAGEPDIERYVDELAALPKDSTEWRDLTQHLTVGETYFFRDQRCLEALERRVLPSLIERRRKEGALRLRIWSAGCSTGEEPYTIAMMLDRLLPDRRDWSLTILGTDLNPRVLAAARRARYREWSMRATPEELRRRYFRPGANGTVEVVPDIREMVTFAPLNLAEDAYPSLATNTAAMDVVLCRNVIMYFTQPAREATLTRLQDALLENGWLVLSAAESAAELLRPLEPVSFPGAVLFRKSKARPPLPAVASTERAQPVRDTRGRARPAPRRTAPVRQSSQPARKPGVATATAGEPGLVARARLEADRGRLEQASELCREAAGRDPLDPEAHLLLAAIEQERGDIAAAIEAVRRGIYLAPDSPAGHFILGSLLQRKGQTAGARRSMLAVVELLASVPANDAVAGADGVPAGRLLETARAYLESAA